MQHERIFHEPMAGANLEGQRWQYKEMSYHSDLEEEPDMEGLGEVDLVDLRSG